MNLKELLEEMKIPDYSRIDPKHVDGTIKLNHPEAEILNSEHLRHPATESECRTRYVAFLGILREFPDTENLYKTAITAYGFPNDSSHAVAYLSVMGDYFRRIGAVCVTDSDYIPKMGELDFFEVLDLAENSRLGLSERGLELINVLCIEPVDKDSEHVLRQYFPKI